jgi:hypothetical protein
MIISLVFKQHKKLCNFTFGNLPIKKTGFCYFFGRYSTKTQNLKGESVKIDGVQADFNSAEKRLKSDKMTFDI